MTDSNTNNAKKATKRTRVILPGGIQGLVRDLQNGTNRSAQTVVEQSDNQKVMDDEENAPKMSQQHVDGVGEQAESQPTYDAQREKTAPNQRTEIREEDRTVQNAENEAFDHHDGQTAAEGRYDAEQPRQNSDIQQNRVGEQSAQEALANSRVAASEMNQPVPSSENGPKSGAFTGQSSLAQPGYRQDGEALSGDHQQQGRGRRPKENTMKSYAIVKDDSRDSWELFLDMAKQYKDGGGKLATIYIDGQLKNILDRMKYVGPDKLTTSAILSSIVARFIYDHEDEIRKVLFSGDLL